MNGVVLYIPKLRRKLTFTLFPTSLEIVDLLQDVGLRINEEELAPIQMLRHQQIAVC
ncbi:hypothetical protein [Chamaesiphon sp. VAR_48_metabat_403]|uniref:hypothetical protein n=1 Tax=Chamaesiphon sp. VAR_48_metabat_403 TaxID=2964700 RepID=UPI00286E963F|nr:hypothetical protein [Chamaesiphon sp. VAR_48_metabat_403]